MSTAQLKKHPQRRRRRAASELTNKDFMCFCGISYCSAGALRTHIKRKHPDTKRKKRLAAAPTPGAPYFDRVLTPAQKTEPQGAFSFNQANISMYIIPTTSIIPTNTNQSIAAPPTKSSTSLATTIVHAPTTTTSIKPSHPNILRAVPQARTQPNNTSRLRAIASASTLSMFAHKPAPLPISHQKRVQPLVQKTTQPRKKRRIEERASSPSSPESESESEASDDQEQSRPKNAIKSLREHNPSLSEPQCILDARSEEADDNSGDAARDDESATDTETETE